MKDIAIILGIRPDVIRASKILKLLESSNNLTYDFIWSGQHYSENMKDVFFEQLNVPKPNVEFEIEKGNAEVLFYYSGHGLPEPNTNVPYIIPVDVNGNSPQLGVSLNDVYTKLTKYPSSKATVVIDACFSGGAINKSLVSLKGIKIRPKINAIAGNLVVFASSMGTESSAVYKEKQHGYFTYFLLKNLQQNATNQNFGDLITNINYQVSKEALKTGKIQTPVVMPGIEVNDNWKTFKW